MFGPPISQSAWIVNTRTSRSWYSGSIFAKSLASILSVNAMSASFSVPCLTLVHWKDDDRAPLGAGHDAQVIFHAGVGLLPKPEMLSFGGTSQAPGQVPCSRWC